MRDEGGIDRCDNKEAKAKSEASHYVDIDSVEHTDARNVGAEWLCKRAMDELGLEDFLRIEGWNENSIYTPLSHLIVRTVYTLSELSTLRYMQENSAVCELYSGIPSWQPGLNALYKMPCRLYALKEKLENICASVQVVFST